MSLKDREIDENGFAIIEPLLQMDVDTKKDEKKYSKIYHRELCEWKSSVSSVVVSLSRRKLHRDCTTRRYRNKNSITGLRSLACTYFLELTL